MNKQDLHNVLPERMIQYGFLMIVFLLAFCASSSFAVPIQPVLKDPIQTFKQEIERLRKELNIPGLSVAVLQGQNVLFADGFGYSDIENKIQARANTPYNIASLTKPLAAAVLMKLVETGRLSLDDEVAKILKVPEEDLTLILLANSDGASAPFRLGDGNVLRSPFAVQFINLFTKLEITPSIPITGAIKNVHEPDHSFKTYIDIIIGKEFTGNLPDDIDTITVTGPSGDLPISKDDFVYLPWLKDFFIRIPGSPEIGTYTFTVTSGNISGSAKDSQSVLKTIPIPDTDTFSPSQGETLHTNTPTFSWSAVKAGEPTYYRFEIYKFRGGRVYSTGYVKGMLSHTVPVGVLSPGQAYHWRVRVTDGDNWIKVQNRSHNQRRSFTMANIASLSSTKSRNMGSFEVVWQTVKEKHFDPTFSGLDWNEVHDRYQPQIASVESDSEFFTLINKMLFELNLSHILVVPPNEMKRFTPILFAEGKIGIDVRLLNDAAVITSVKLGSPGAQAGLRPGFLIQSIDGKTIEQIAVEKPMIPPFNNRNRRNSITQEILGRIYGAPDTPVSIVWLDEDGQRHEKVVKRKGRGPGRVISDALPRFFIEFEAKRLENNIGYIWFNHFVKPVDEKFINAIKSMRDAPGLIIDLRGNTGGYFKVADTIAKHLLAKKTLFSTFRFRDRTVDNILIPADGAYEGLVVVLIDVMSTSCSEHFAGCIQAIDRAVIVGERSPGYLLVANWMKLWDGASFMYSVAQTLPPDGTVIEAHGVVPDIEVELDRTLLIKGFDSQLEKAIDYIKNKKKKG